MARAERNGFRQQSPKRFLPDFVAAAVAAAAASFSHQPHPVLEIQPRSHQPHDKKPRVSQDSRKGRVSKSFSVENESPDLDLFMIT